MWLIRSLNKKTGATALKGVPRIVGIRLQALSETAEDWTQEPQLKT
jgi:hypothetical protein